MRTDSTSATVFMAKDIHMELSQAFLFISGVPQATIVGSVTHWKAA